MVSSSTVESDASLISDLFSNYKTGITAISKDTVWNGKSKTNAVDQMNNFVDQFLSPITSQMDEFSTAAEKYKEWEDKKKELETAEADLEKARHDETIKDLYSYTSKVNRLKDEVEDLSKEIKECLENVESKELDIESTVLTPKQVSLGEFINYYQYDYQQSYGYGSTIANAGCGPTSMAMVASYLTGETHDPVEMANWSLNHGHRIQGNGTAWSYFPAVAKAYDLDCTQESVTASGITSALKNGKQIIVNVGPGTFTKGGHYIVLKGITDDNKILVADPNSEERSSKQWDVDVFVREGKGMWTFSSDRTSEMTI